MFAALLSSFVLANVLGNAAPPDLGVELPTLGITFHNSWKWTFENYFSSAVAGDIAKGLHATYVRTGWSPNWWGPRHPWVRENQVLDGICGAGLHVMIIVPSAGSDERGDDHLLRNVADFFTHFTQREPGCLRYAEISNEADLPVNGFSDVSQYARYYAKVAPIVAGFGIPVITSGVSGKDLPWTQALGAAIRSDTPPPPVAGFGFHPYGVPVADLTQAVTALAAAAGPQPDGSASRIYVTEIGRADASALYRTILELAGATPAITVYEYRAQPNDPDDRYGLKDHPELYDAVARAFERVRGYRP